MTTPPSIALPRHSAPPAHDRPSRARCRRARVCLYLLLLPVFLKILWLHFTCSQGSQFARLGEHRRRPASPLPEGWARWAANKITRLVHRLPLIRQRPCYWRCQLMYDLLPRFGFPVELHLGTQPDTDRIGTHLWVTTGGVVLGDEPGCAARYLELGVYTVEVIHD